MSHQSVCSVGGVCETKSIIELVAKDTNKEYHCTQEKSGFLGYGEVVG